MADSKASGSLGYVPVHERCCKDLRLPRLRACKAPGTRPLYTRPPESKSIPLVCWRARGVIDHRSRFASRDHIIRMPQGRYLHLLTCAQPLSHRNGGGDCRPGEGRAADSWMPVFPMATLERCFDALVAHKRHIGGCRRRCLYVEEGRG